MADEELNDAQLDGVEAAEAEEDKGDGEDKSLQDKLKEVIDVQVEEVGPLRRKLTITVPRDTLDGQVNEQYDELRREAVVPGFRKGRAPRRLLEKRFGSEVGETLVQQLVSTGYMAAMDKTELKVLGDPLIYVKSEKEGEGESLLEVQEAIAKMKLPADGPLTYCCEVELRPEFELPLLEGIPIEKPIATITDDDVKEQVDRILSLQGTYVPVAEGGVEADDLVVADLKLTCEGTELKKEDGVRLAARPQVVDGVVLEKLGDTLKGAKAGDVVKVSGTIPDDYAKTDFCGKRADFEFAIRDVQRMQLPELNEDFLKGFGFDSEKDMQDWIRADLESRLGEEFQRGLRGQVCQYLMDKTSFDVPERLSNRQIAQVTTNRLLELYHQGVSPSEVEKNLDEFKTGAREDAIRQLKLTFIMEKLAEEIEVEVSEGEINTRIAAIAQRQNQRFDRVRDELAKRGAITTLYIQLRDDKILDELITKAAVTAKTIEEIKSARKSSQKKAADEAAAPAEQQTSEQQASAAGSAEAESVAAAGEDESANAPKPRSQVKRKPPKAKSGAGGEDSADAT